MMKTESSHPWAGFAIRGIHSNSEVPFVASEDVYSTGREPRAEPHLPLNRGLR
jgi:hypothetical protein